MIAASIALLAAQVQEPAQGIPMRYHGVWDAYPAACSYEISDMRLAIGSDEFTIYRDRFRVQHVTVRDGDSLVVSVAYRAHDDLDNKGFGNPYDLVIKLSDAESKLTISGDSSAITWHRCPTRKEAP